MPHSYPYVLSALLAFGLLGTTTIAAADKDQAGTAAGTQPTSPMADRANVDRILTQWPERPRLGALMMIGTYGTPQEATPERFIWRDQGPYLRITVTRQEDAHDFPKPHVDFLEHTIAYRVPADKAAALFVFDGSLTYDRTTGELSARCDLESHNILTLNLAHDVVTGKRDAQDARAEFGKQVVADAKGQPAPYLAGLMFTPEKMVADPDKPVIPGSSMRADGKIPESGDATALGFLVALNDNEILAASVAGKKQVSGAVKDFAKMLHTEHGKNLEATLKLGEQIKVTPVITSEVDALSKKGAADLGKLVPLDGKEFEQAFIATMITGHREALTLIDGLMAKAEQDGIKKHLRETKGHLEAHLKAAEALKTKG